MGGMEGGEMTQTLYSHMNKIKIKKNKMIATFVESLYILFFSILFI
jgi:hypothetical protein